MSKESYKPPKWKGVTDTMREDAVRAEQENEDAIEQYTLQRKERWPGENEQDLAQTHPHLSGNNYEPTTKTGKTTKEYSDRRNKGPEQLTIK
jgi:hypothetical protein